MTRIYAIGDIHGRLDLLDELLADIAADAGDVPHKIVFLGDYVDRGRQSAGVIDRLIELSKGDNPPVILKGNHEKVMQDMLTEDFTWVDVPTWMKYGGDANLRSYGGRVPRDPARYPDMLKHFQKAVAARGHDAFLDTLPTSYQTDTHFFCHAGVDFKVPLDEQVDEDLMWIREYFLKSPRRADKIVVHGHSISPMPEVTHSRIGVDTAAYRSGMLTAVVLDAGERPRFLATGGYTEAVNSHYVALSGDDGRAAVVGAAPPAP